MVAKTNDQGEETEECMNEESNTYQPMGDTSTDIDSIDDDLNYVRKVDSSSMDDETFHDTAVSIDQVEDEEMSSDQNNEIVR